MLNQLYILNADNSINWERYKEYTEHYHNQHCPLSKPYNEEELRQICVEKQIELPETLFNYLTKVSNIIYIEEGYLSSTVFDVSNYKDFEKKHNSFEEYIIKNFDRRYMHNIEDIENECNYPVDSVTEKHNEDTRKMTIEVIDKVFAEYLEKNKDSIYIYYPKKEDWDWNWKPLSNDDDW